jgi:hypothetical protein
MTSPSTTRQPRNARRGCSDSRSPIHIRRSRITDLPQLRKMARLHGRELPEGRFLVAETRSTIVAAAPLDNDDHAFGSPDLCSEQLQELLRSQTSLAGSGRGSAEAATRLS